MAMALSVLPQPPSNKRPCPSDEHDDSRLPPVIISITGKSFKGLSINIKEAVVKSLIEQANEPHLIQVQSRGDIFVHPKSSEQQAILLGIKELAGNSVSCSLPKSSSLTRGVAINVPVSLKEEDLLQNLQDQGVTSVKRLTRTTSKGKEDTESILLGFNRPLPRRVRCFYWSFQVRPFYPSPNRCTKCQRLGHTTDACGQPVPSCSNCCRPHEGENQTCEPWCINCKTSGHRPDDQLCPALLAAKDVITMSVDEKITFKEARARLTSLSSRKALHADPAPSKEIELLKMEISALKKDVAVIKGVNLPAIDSSILDVNKRVDSTEEKIQSFRVDINKRLDFFGTQLQKIASFMGEMAKNRRKESEESEESDSEDDRMDCRNPDVPEGSSPSHDVNGAGQGSSVPPAQEGEVQLRPPSTANPLSSGIPTGSSLQLHRPNSTQVNRFGNPGRNGQAFKK